jgi:hypothetical protein
MTLHRFATSFIPFAYFFLLLLASRALAEFPRARVGLLAIAVCYSMLLFGVRTAEFADHPTVAFQDAAAAYGQRYDNAAAELELENASVLLSDLGGVLYNSHLRIYDLAGLTDHTIARSLAGDQERLHDYVFEEIKPTFIHTHMPWTQLASLDDDPRFRRDYEPISEKPVPGAKTRLGAPLIAGDYVRKDSDTRN